MATRIVTDIVRLQFGHREEGVRLESRDVDLQKKGPHDHPHKARREGNTANHVDL